MARSAERGAPPAAQPSCLAFYFGNLGNLGNLSDMQDHKCRGDRASRSGAERLIPRHRGKNRWGAGCAGGGEWKAKEARTCWVEGAPRSMGYSDGLFEGRLPLSLRFSGIRACVSPADRPVPGTKFLKPQR